MKKISCILFLFLLFTVSGFAQSKISIKVEVFSEDDDKSDAASFVTRELRSLGDVELTEKDSDPNTVLFFLKVSKIENQKRQQTGYIIRYEAVKHIRCGDKMILAYIGSYATVGNELRKTIQDLVVFFDQHSMDILRKERNQ